MSIFNLILTLVTSFIQIQVFIQYLKTLLFLSHLSRFLVAFYITICIISFAFCLSLFFSLPYSLLLILLCIGIYFLFSSRRKSVFLPETSQFKITQEDVIISGLLLLFTRNFFLTAEKWGSWDAWSIWNLHAKFLASETSWQQMLITKIDWTHPDYPLFLPSIIAFIWQNIHTIEPYTPIIFSYMITISIPLVLYSVISSDKKFIFGYGFFIIFLADYNFLTIASSQCADTLLGLFYLLTIIFFYHNQFSKKSSFFIGLLGATCGWIKNEGLLFYFVILIFFLYINYSRKEILIQFLLGSFLPLIVILFYKITYAPPNDLVIAQSSNSLKQLLSLSRYMYTGKYIINTLFLKFPIILSLLLIAIFIGIPRKEMIVFFILSVVLTGYFFVYIITPHDLYWHLSTSCERLIHQLYPSFLFCTSCVIVNQSTFLQRSNKTISTI